MKNSRREFILLTNLDCFSEKNCSVEKFELLAARVREDEKLVNAPARFERQVCDSRECWFRQPSCEASKQRFAELFEARFNIQQPFRSCLYLIDNEGSLGFTYSSKHGRTRGCCW